MIVVTNRIPVAQGHEIDFEDRFRKRLHLVDESPGFIRNEVHRPRPRRFDHESGGFVDDPEERRRLLYEIIEIQEKRLGHKDLAFMAACRAFGEEGSILF